MQEATVKKSVRKFTLWPNESTAWHKDAFKLGSH